MSLAFRAAVEARDLTAMEAALHPDVVFRSPAVHKPYEGREVVIGLLRHVVGVMADLHYVDQLETGDSHVLVFRATAGDRQVEGIDYCKVDGDGLITELVVMVRPLTGLVALAEAMGARISAA